MGNYFASVTPSGGLFTRVRGREFCELRHNGVLGSSGQPYSEEAQPSPYTTGEKSRRVKISSEGRP